MINSFDLTGFTSFKKHIRGRTHNQTKWHYDVNSNDKRWKMTNSIQKQIQVFVNNFSSYIS